MDWFSGLTVGTDPDSVLDWAWDWSDWLESTDSLSDHTATPESGITVSSSSIIGDNVVVWITGGTPGTTYSVTVHAITTEGREIDRSVNFQVIEK